MEGNLLTIKKRVMRRVYMVYLVRLATRPVLLKLYALFACLSASAAYVSLSAIYSNMPVGFDWQAQYRFYAEAIAHTEMVVQMLVLGGALATGLLVYDIVRSGIFSTTRRQMQLQ